MSVTQIILNESTMPIPVTFSEEALSIKQVMDVAEEQLKSIQVVDEESGESTVEREAHEDYRTFENVHSGLKNNTVKPEVNGYQVRLGTPRTVVDGDIITFQIKGELGL